MALRVELSKEVLKRALEAMITVLSRNNARELNPLMRDLRDKDILTLQTAIGTISDIK